MWCWRRRPRRRPRGLGRVPVFRCYRMMNPRPTPPTKARRRRRKPLPQRGEGGKGRPPQRGRPKGPRRGKLFPRTALPTPATTTRTGLQGPSPWRDRKYPDSRITSWFFFSPHNVFLMPHTTLQSAQGRSSRFIERVLGCVGYGFPSDCLHPQCRGRR